MALDRRTETECIAICKRMLGRIDLIESDMRDIFACLDRIDIHISDILGTLERVNASCGRIETKLD